MRRLGDSPVDWLDASLAIWAIALTVLVLGGLTYGLLYTKHVEQDLDDLRDRFIRFEESLDKDRRAREMMLQQQYQIDSLGRDPSRKD